MSQCCNTLNAWIAAARDKLKNAEFLSSDLDALQQLVQSGAARQRLLYLHAESPHIGSLVISMDEHPPDGDLNGDLDAEPVFPYDCVHAAIKDGWQVVKFPDNRSAFDDRENDVLGYEFILQKMEVIHAS